MYIHNFLNVLQVFWAMTAANTAMLLLKLLYDKADITATVNRNAQLPNCEFNFMMTYIQVGTHTVHSFLYTRAEIWNAVSNSVIKKYNHISWPPGYISQISLKPVPTIKKKKKKKTPCGKSLSHDECYSEVDQ